MKLFNNVGIYGLTLGVFFVLVIFLTYEDIDYRVSNTKDRIENLKLSSDIINLFGEAISSKNDESQEFYSNLERLLVNNRILFNNITDITNESLNLFDYIENKYKSINLRDKTDHLVYFIDYVNKVLITFDPIKINWSDKIFEHANIDCSNQLGCEVIGDDISVNDNIVIYPPYEDILTNNTIITITSFFNVGSNIYSLSEDVYLNWDEHLEWSKVVKKGKDKVINVRYKGLFNLPYIKKIEYQIDDVTKIVFKSPIIFITETLLLKLLGTSLLMLLVLYFLRKKTYAEKESVFDVSTGCYNKKLFYRNDFEHLINTSNNLYVFVVDGNGIKIINDKYGHLVGDQAIKFIASYINVNINKTDLLVRFGGDEFVILKFNLNEEDIDGFVRNIKRIKDKPFVVIGRGETLNLSVSIGVSKFNGSLSKALSEADEVMYMEKSAQNSR